MLTLETAAGQLYEAVVAVVTTLVTIIKTLLSRADPGKQATRHLILPPGDMGYPVIGETIAFLKTGQDGTFFEERFNKYGPIFKTNFLGMDNIHVSDPKHVKRILLGEHDLVKVNWPPSMTRLLGEGSLSTSPETCHRNLRKRTKCAMGSPEILRQYVPVMVSCITEELAKWAEEAQIDVYKSAKLLTMKTASQVVLGPEDITNSTVEQLSEDFVTFGEGFFQVPLAIPGTTYAKAWAAKRRIMDILTELHRDGCSRPSIMKSMFNDRENSVMSQERMNLTIELLFGAQETVACTVTCAMYLLDKYPHALERLREEVDEHITFLDGSGDGVPWRGLDDLNNMSYLSSVIKETTRLFPPIGGGYRKVLKSFQLGEYTIPKDWTITYSVSDIHNNNNNDEVDVGSFDPDRWTKDEHPSNFMPFGAGARVCVGKMYAKQFTRLTLIALVSQYRWKTMTKDVKFTRVPIVRPETPLMATFLKN